MDDYKTVKEVCALTGLTGKHLYYFHHENVVRAVAYANYSVEGNDGYKLYDEAGVEKLRQIALYYQLGLKRNEIRDLMLDPEIMTATASCRCCCTACRPNTAGWSSGLRRWSICRESGLRTPLTASCAAARSRSLEKC